jgi:hypothetical protein
MLNCYIPGFLTPSGVIGPSGGLPEWGMGMAVPEPVGSLAAVRRLLLPEGSMTNRQSAD